MILERRSATVHPDPSGVTALSPRTATVSCLANSTKSARPGYRCAECGVTVAKWLGRCPECQAWGTLEELGVPKPRTVKAGPVSAPAKPIG